MKKITEILNIYEKNPNFKGKPSFKKWCNYSRQYGHSIAECRQKQQDNQNKPQKHKEPNKSFYQYMKKDQILPNKNIYSNNSSSKPLPGNSNYSRNQSPYNSSYRGRLPEQRNSRNFSQNRYSRSNSQNNQNRYNYSRSNSNTTEFISASSSHSNPRNRHYSNNRSQNLSYNRNRNYSNNRIEFIQIIEIRTIQTTDQGTTHIIDQINKDQMITIITDHEIIHKTETRVTTIDTETIPSHPIGIITVTPVLNIDTEVTYQSIKDTSIKNKQMKKQLQTPQMLIIQKIMNYISTTLIVNQQILKVIQIIPSQ